MSQLFINQYYQDIEKYKSAGKTKNESSIRKAFLCLVEKYAEKYNLVLIDELPLFSNNKAIPDATLRTTVGLDNGYIENKDLYDNLETEIQEKIKKGYPLSNTIFENCEDLVFYQYDNRIAKIKLSDAGRLDEILNKFVSYKRPEISQFEQALKQFTEDIPTILKHLRKIIDAEYKTNEKFKQASLTFLENCHQAINPHLTFTDVREMIIQHILTEDIFTSIFSDADFHRENNVAKGLTDLIHSFFKEELKRNTLNSIKHYYDTIKIASDTIADHTKKQDFLKVIYENFYKAYNPKKADTQGIIYTPTEVIKFIISACDYLLYEHFNKTLADKNVEILDPCTGTGVFITELLKHLRGNPKLTYKYEQEIHCNELELLPYYIANLNIEYIYKQITGQYKSFENICLVDTLDNIMKERDLFGMAGFSDENLERVRKQNKRKISVIIGNPPYNANQRSENENNKNKPYPNIDSRIKETYVAESTAQKTKLYDMYSRFIRWASDRIKDEGIVAFISNNSFLDAKSYDGMRKCFTKEFSHIYSVNLKGDARTSGEARKKEGGNIFENKIREGIAISFFVRQKNNKDKTKMFVYDIADYLKLKGKRDFIKENKFKNIKFTQKKLTDKNYFVDTDFKENDFNTFIPLIDKTVKNIKIKAQEHAIFKLFSNGINTARDSWVYDFDKKNLSRKIKKFISLYTKQLQKNTVIKKGKELSNSLDYSIKWSDKLKNIFLARKKLNLNNDSIRKTLYRPFTEEYLYFNSNLNDRCGLFEQIFPNQNSKNATICITNNAPFVSLATSKLISFDAVTHCVSIPLFHYSEVTHKLDNITDWGLEQFQKHYKDKKITKKDIFYYCYGVLNNPQYKTKYRENLKTEYPRIPFYTDFNKWANWGSKLADLHINFENQKDYDLIILKSSKNEKPMFKIDKEAGIIRLDDSNIIRGIPQEAFNYKIGSRSALEWLLEGHKPKKLRPEKELHHKTLVDNKLDFYDWKTIRTKLLNLIPKITTVSVETIKIHDAMSKESIK